MKRKIISLLILLILSFNISGCTAYVDSSTAMARREVTELYSIDKYLIHEAGVEIWGVSDTGEEVGFFIEHEKVYSCEEDTSRVVVLYCCSIHRGLRESYLYFSESDFKEYIKDLYDIE